MDPVREAERVRDINLAAAEAEFQRDYLKLAARLQQRERAAWDAYLTILYGSRRAA